MSKKHIVVGLSGGVDSAITAYLLQQQGHHISTVYMQNWETDNDDPFCSAHQDLTDAKAVADHLGLDFHIVNFAAEYWQRVFQYCLDEFQHGRTPNPDIWCNKEIKFNTFLQHAREIGADYLATGHYAKIHSNANGHTLNKAADSHKDQSYFLYTLNQSQLTSALFPLADMCKTDVRQLATQIKLPNATKKDSTGICFIGERKFKTFLQEFILGKPGAIVTDNGDNVGQHDGLMYYTLGQRKGLNIGGIKNKAEAPWYVIAKDIPNNQLIVGQGHNHPALYHRQLICNQLHWVQSAPSTPYRCHAKIRYGQQDQACTIEQVDSDQYAVRFEQPQWAITPGQAIVFYNEAECLGGGTIISMNN